MRKTVVIDVVGLTPALLGPGTPRLAAWAAKGGVAPIAPVLPAVTTTGTPVAVTGTFSIETAAFSVCSTEPDCDGADSPTSEDVTVRIRGITGTFANPFDGGGYVLLYFTDGLGRNHFIGKATAFQTNDDNVNRDYIYTITFNALGLDALKYAIADGTAIDVTAVGVTAAGDAITLTSVGLATIEH